MTIRTDPLSLEEWVNENVDTPSGPWERKAQLHTTLAQFTLEMKHILGKDNVVAV